jgi:hypothetical protein
MKNSHNPSKNKNKIAHRRLVKKHRSKKYRPAAKRQ